jgi:hypothetical protein
MTTSETLKAASDILEGLEETYEYRDNCIQVYHLGQLYQFGEANVGEITECYGYDIFDDDNQLVSSDDLIGFEATPEELAQAIRETIT